MSTKAALIKGVPFFLGSLMVSGSGDGTLKVWNFLKGKVVSSVICAQDAKLKELDIDTNKEQHQFKRTTSWPSILGVQIVPEAANTKNMIKSHSIIGEIQWNFGVHLFRYVMN